MIRRTTWIVLLMFLVVLAGLVWVQRSNQDQEPEIAPTTANQSLFDLQEQALTRIAVQSSDGKNLELVRPAQGEWSLTQPQNAPADSAAVQSALSQFLSSTIVSSPGSLPGLEALNLENALYKILLVSQDGSQIVLNIGNETPTGSGYYVLASNQSQVVVVNKFGLDALLNLLENPPLLPTPAAEIELTEGVEQTQVP
jgi:hypothetical protein